VTHEFTAEAFMSAMRHATNGIKSLIAPLVEAAARGMAADHERAYPRSNGPTNRAGGKHLANSYRIKRDESPAWMAEHHSLRWQVQNWSPYVHLVELGTRERYARTRNGKALSRPAYRGRMPKIGPIFVPLATSRRAEMLRSAEGVLYGSHEI